MTGLGMLPLVLVRRCLPLSLLAISVAGCSGSGTETGNPSLMGNLGYTGYSSQPDDYGIGSAGRIAKLDAAWFSLGRVTTAGCTAALDFEASPLGLGDHAAGSHVSTPFTADSGRFCSVRLPFSAVGAGASGAGAPDALDGHALLLSGLLADGTPFTLISDAHPVVGLAAEGEGFELASGSTDLLIAFDFAVWLEDVDFAAAIRAEDGGITISSDENSDLLAAFDAKLAPGITLYRDRDADAILDDDPEVLATAR